MSLPQSDSIRPPESEFNSVTIPWKGTDGIITDQQVLLKKSLKFGDFGIIIKKSGFNMETSGVEDPHAFMVTLIQLAVEKAPFDQKQVEQVLDLDGNVAMTIFKEALKSLPLGQLSEGLGINLPDSLLKT